MDQLSNQVLHDRYRIQSLLGRKTGRRTFLAHDLQTQATVVIKLLLFGADFTWEDLKLFEREAETLKTLNQPSIPQYLDSFEVDTELGKGFALVQSYIEARSLQDWIQAGRNFSEAELRVIATELLGILAYLHSRQPPVIHRDMKPTNILLGDRSGNRLGQVYLVDFGSVQTTAHGGTITVVGTYGYMPPEQFGGRTAPASDVYGLGATLIYLLTKTHPADLPSRNGQIRFENEHLASEQFQTWLRYLTQPDLSQRPKSAQAALEALKDDRLTSSSLNPVRLKPSGSRITLTKTEEQLKIVIPPLRIGQKLEVIHSTLWLTVFACSPLLLGFWKLEAGLLVAPAVLWMVSASWVRSIYRMFARMQLTIDESKIYLTFGWLGCKKRYSSPTQDIIKLECLRYKINNQDTSNPQTQLSGLHLWIGNQCHSFGVFNLTEVELDWLAVELSDWLGLPIQTSGEVMTSNRPDQMSTKATTTKSSGMEETSPIIFAPPISRISRPENTRCKVYRNPETVEISAPAASGMWLKVLAFASGVILFISGVQLTNLAAALLLGSIPVVLWKIGDWMNHRGSTTMIVLRIDQQNISLWEQSQAQQWRCLKRKPRRAVYKLQLYTTLCTKGKQSCHVKVCTAYSGDDREDSFLVGNRSFWLSRSEAEWLANELGIWLNLPVTEVEVIDNSA